MQAPPSHAVLLRNLAFLRAHGLLIAAVTVTAIAAASATSFTEAKVYRASTKIVVGQGGGVFQPQFGNVIQPFTQTMSSLLKSEIVATTTIRRLRLHESPKALLRRVHVASNPDSAVLEVSYDAATPSIAVRTLNVVASVFTELVHNRLGKTTGKGQTALPGISATVFDPAHASSSPIAPHPKRTIAIAGVLGLALGFILALLREALATGERDTTPSQRGQEPAASKLSEDAART